MLLCVICGYRCREQEAISRYTPRTLNAEQQLPQPDGHGSGAAGRLQQRPLPTGGSRGRQRRGGRPPVSLPGG